MKNKGYIVPLVVSVVALLTIGIVYIVTTKSTTSPSDFNSSQVQGFNPIDSYRTPVASNEDQNGSVTQSSGNNMVGYNPIYNTPDNTNGLASGSGVSTNGNSATASYLNTLATQSAAKNNTKILATNSLSNYSLGSFFTNSIGITQPNNSPDANVNASINSTNTTYNGIYSNSSQSSGQNTNGNTTGTNGYGTGSNSSTGSTGGSSGSGSGSGGGSGIGTAIGGAIVGGVASYAISSLLSRSSSSGGGASGGMKYFGALKVDRITECTCAASRLLDMSDLIGNNKLSLLVTPGTQVGLYAKTEYAITQQMKVAGFYTQGGQCLVYEGEDCDTQGNPDGTVTSMNTSAM